MSVNIPIYAPFTANISGLRMTWLTTTTMQVELGQCSDSTVVNEIVLTAATPISTAQQGAGGLDIGTIAASTMYAVYVIGDSTDYNPTAALISLSDTQPLLPGGYDMFRKVGHVLTDGSSYFLVFRQFGNGVDRTFYYDVAIAELTGGTSATYAAVDLSSSVPLEATSVILKTALTPTAAGNSVEIRPTGSSATNGYSILSGAVAAVVQTLDLVTVCSALASIDYKVTGAVTLSTQGYVESL